MKKMVKKNIKVSTSVSLYTNEGCTTNVFC